MNCYSTSLRNAFKLIGLFAVLFFSIIPRTNAQLVNHALTAADTNINGGTTATGYGPGLYNDGVIPAYLGIGANMYSYVNYGQEIQFYWSSTSGTFPKTIRKIVFYFNDRWAQSMDIQVGGSGTWTTVHSYSNVNTDPHKINIRHEADSFFLSTPIVINSPADTLRLANVFGSYQGSSATFREIQLWGTAAPCTNAPVFNMLAATRSIAQTIGPTITPTCFGEYVYLRAQTLNPNPGHEYIWQKRPTTTSPWTTIPGVTGPGYSFPAVYSQYYRILDTCVNGVSPATPSSNNIQVIVPAMTYQSLTPNYYMGFDNAWSTSPCLTAPLARELPAAYLNGWNNGPSLPVYNSVVGLVPPISNLSWRIDSVGATTSGWQGAGTGFSGGVGVPTTGRSARIRTGGNQTSLNTPGNLDLYVDCSNTTEDKQIYFYFNNAFSGAVPGGDSLKIYMSTDSTDNWSLLGSFDTAQIWKKRSVPLPSNSAKTVIRFQGMKYVLNDGSDIGLDSIFVAGPCSAAPVAGFITQATPTTGCTGSSFFLTTVGTTMAGNLVYQWEQSTNGGVTWIPTTCGTGANTQYFTTPALYDTIQYRMGVKCGPAGTFVYTNPVVFNVAEPQYVSTLPYFQSFESTWSTRCSANDVPTFNWANSPSTGNNSWRRGDPTTNPGTGVWPNNVTSGLITTTPYPNGSYCARFHSAGSFPGQTGNLELFMNGSINPGTKQLSFYYHNNAGNDSLRVFYSDNGGCSFTQLGALGQTVGWQSYSFNMPSNAAQTIIRFQGYGNDFGGTTDIGLDSVKVLPPCAGTPVAGAISAPIPCPGQNFTMNLTGYTIGGGITYQWESAPSATGPWTAISGATNTFYIANILQDTYFRVIVSCTNSGQSSTSAVQFVQVASFYYCYCNGGATSTSGADVGNFSIRRLPGAALALNNGSATPLTNNTGANKTYSDFRGPIGPPVVQPTPTVGPAIVYQDSSYVFYVTQINSAAFTAATVSVWVDTNRNGLFDPNERAMLQYTSASSNPPQQVNDTFRIGAWVPRGYTGLRVVLEPGTNPNPTPCGNYATGETEDYLIFVEYPPCNGPSNPGVAFISDTSSCVGYTVTVVDTTHEYLRSGVSWLWEYSPDGNAWSVVPGSQGRDTVVHTLSGPIFFRMRVVCNKGFAFDTTYSNVVSCSIAPPYNCYCASFADGGSLDSSDIGIFTIGPYTIKADSLVGPHLMNNLAFRSRTDFGKVPFQTTSGVMEFDVDSTYNISVYHTMKGTVHHDSKITLFMDFNNNFVYDVTPTYSERILTAYTTANNFTLNTSITIPHIAMGWVKTGMRLILNNNVNPNVQSDSACGPYTSGETEDFVVYFRNPNQVPPTGIAGTNNIAQLALYPNPTEGRFSLTCVTHRAVEKASVIVTSVTGQKIIEKVYENPGKEFTKELDLSGMARGVYLVEMKADNEKLIRKVVVK